MEKFKIRVLYDEILKKPTKVVSVFDKNLEELTEKMRIFMHESKGMGLSANQIGLDMQLFVLELKPNPKRNVAEIPFTAICNPKITRFSKEKENTIEGCLSIPRMEADVVRSSGITITGQDTKGKKITIKAKGLLARIMQHETDHLNGILYTQHAESITLENLKFARILFFGSDDFSLIILKSLLGSGLNITNIITESDKPAGRNMAPTPTIVKKYALEKEISVLTPETKGDILPLVKDLNPDIIILASYGKILPEEVLSVPSYGAVNVHPSLLPKYRGATPIQSVLLDGEPNTGVTIMLMTGEVDSGQIIAQKELKIEDDDTTPSLKQKLAKLGAETLLLSLPKYMAALKEPTAQLDEATNTQKLTKDTALIDWNKPIESIERQIRALKPWPGTYTTFEGKKLEIIKAHIKDGKLCFDEVQLEGKKPTNWQDFKRGYLNRLTNELWLSKIG